MEYKQEVVNQAIAMLESSVARFETKTISDAEGIGAFLRLKYGRLKTEVFGIVKVDQKNRVIGSKVIDRGVSDKIKLYPRKTMKYILSDNLCTGYFIFHNHPSGCGVFSESDIALTKKYKAISDFLEIRLLDHILITKDSVISYQSALGWL